MSEYVDIQLLNCNKSASIEERTADSNKKQSGKWTNQLNQSVLLNVGDVVTVQSALINDVGASQQQPIEFPGQTLPKQYDVIYTTITPSKPITDMTNSNYRLGIYTEFKSERSKKTFDIKNNEANITVGYYINTSEHPEYICQPRRWVQKEYFSGAALFLPQIENPANPDATGWANSGIYANKSFGVIPNDSHEGQEQDISTRLRDIWNTWPNADTGLCIDEPLLRDNYCQADWMDYPVTFDGHAVPDTMRLKMIIRNERFTLYVNNDSFYHDEAHANIPSVRVEMWAESKFLRYLELKTIKVDEGFNTPSSIAEQITSQLNEEENPVDFEVMDNTDPNFYIRDTAPKSVRKLVTTMETPLYKPINCASWEEGQKSYYESYIQNTDLDKSQMNKYYSSMTQYIGVKRPEIWDAGRYITDSIGTQGIPLQPTISDNGEEDNFIAQIKGLQGVGMYNDVISLATNPTTDPGDNTVDPLILQMEYNKTNLDALKKLFEAQGLYPELFEHIEKLNDYNHLDDGDLSVDNCRYVHINRYQSIDTPVAVPVTASQQRYLGYDNLNETNQPHNKCSHALFFEYDGNQKDTYYEPIDVDYNENDDNTKLTYGFAQAVLSRNIATKPYGPGDARATTTVPPLFGDIYLIALRVDRAGGFPSSLFTEVTPHAFEHEGSPVTTGTRCIRFGRRCLYDYHATAFGTCIITPYSGISPFSYTWDTDETNPDNENRQRLPLWNTTLQAKWQSLTKLHTDFANRWKPLETSCDSIMRYATQLYIGANNPKLSYDPESNRFSFEQLHTPTNVSNDDWVAGNPLLAAEYPIRDNQSQIVYKINPKIPRKGFSPEFMPYGTTDIEVGQPFKSDLENDPDKIKSVEKLNRFMVHRPNFAIQQSTVFDSHGGVYIDGWGFDEDSWDGCLWDIMGFTYEQLNGKATPNNVLTQRTTNKNTIHTYRLTTSCDIVATDMKNRVMNPYEAGFFTNQLSLPMTLLNWKVNDTSDANVSYRLQGIASNIMGEYHMSVKVFPQFMQPTNSLKITADGLCKAMLRPYFNIHSSIISDPNSIGGGKYSVGSVLPIMAVCNKYSAQGDYFFGSSDLNFTITKKQVFSDIVTEIRNPDGTLADVDRGCAVIYKIIRKKAAPVNIIAQMLEELQKSKK